MLKSNEKRWTERELQDFKWRAVTIPINVKIPIHQTALHLENVLEIVQSAKKIAVADCICRTKLQNCNHLVKVCLSLNEAAETNVSQGRSEFISKSNAEKILLETHQKGLVHLALYLPDDNETHTQAICSCCACCCHVLQGLLLMNMEELVKPSPYLATYDQEKCINCGECISRCQFKARTQNDEDSITFNPNLCYGCGLCVTNCSENAITMIKRELA